MINGPALGIILAAALAYFAATETWIGIKWVGKETKKAGTAIVHVIKRIPH